MLKILLVISEVPPITSGISRVASRLKTGLMQLGNHVDTLSLEDVPRFVRGEVRLSSMAWKAATILLPRLDSYDIVHVHGPVPTFSDVALLLSALVRRSKRPLLVYTHHCEIDLRGLRLLCDLYNWSHKQIGRLADQVVVSSPSYARDLGRFIPAGRIAVVPWGVDDDGYDEATVKPDELSVLFVGQLRPYKGVDTLLKAVKRVRGVNLQIIGSGHQEQQYRQFALDNEMEGVTFRGRVSDADLFDAYARSHVIVLPSTTRAEAFGIVLLEGMLARCVPIVSQLPGIVDLVEDVGMTFPVGDDEALARLLIRLRDDNALRHDLGQRARARAKQYSWERTVYWHHALYRRVYALNRFGRSLAGGSEDTALELLLQDSISTLDATSGSIMLVDPDEATLHLRASTGLALTTAQYPGQPMNQGIAGFVAMNGTPLLLPEGLPSVLARFPDLSIRRHINSSLSVPIVSDSRVLGVMNMSSSDNVRVFRDADLQWLSGLAESAGNHIMRRRNLVGSK